MSRTAEKKTVDFSSGEFIDLVESIEEPKVFEVNDLDTKKQIVNDIEDIKIGVEHHGNNDNRRYVERKFRLNGLKGEQISVDTKKYISDRYEPVSFSESIIKLRDSNVLSYIKDEIDTVGVDFENGTFDILFNSDNLNEDVLDILPNEFSRNLKNHFGYSDFEIRRRNFGEYQPRLRFLNSFDRTVSLGLQFGTFRLVCKNGMMMFESMFGIKKRHFTSSREEVLETIPEMFQKVPMMLNSKSEYYKESKNNKFNRSDIEIISNDFRNRLDNWMDNKKNGKTYKSNKTIRETTDSLYETFDNMWKDNTFKNQIENKFDISNIFSFFTSNSRNTNRFSVVENNLSKELQRQMDKVLVNV